MKINAKIKRLGILLVCCSLLSVNKADAREFIASGDFTNHFEAGDASQLFMRPGFTKSDEHFKATMRYRLGFTYKENENLSAHFLLQIGASLYGESQLQDGTPVTPFGKDGEITRTRLRLGYLDWTFPNTDLKIRMGYHQMDLPGFVGQSPLQPGDANIILGARANGVSFGYRINENINLSGFWGMGNNLNGFVDFDRPAPKSLGPTGDTGTLYATILKFDYDTFRVYPWLMHASVGKNVNSFGMLPLGNDDDFTGYYMGASFEYTGIESWKFAFDGVYSISKLEDNEKTQNFDGYFMGAKVAYYAKNGVPALKAWYSSGDKNVTGFEAPAKGVNGLRLQPKGDLGRPSSIVSFFMPTSMFYGDQIQDNGFSSYRSYNPDGTWGIAAEVSQFTIIKKFQHTARVAYIGGSNEIINDAIKPSVMYMGTDDRLVEFNFNTYHWIYKNFLATLELGAIIPDFADATSEDDAINYRSALSFMYFF